MYSTYTYIMYAIYVYIHIHTHIPGQSAQIPGLIVACSDLLRIKRVLPKAQPLVRNELESHSRVTVLTQRLATPAEIVLDTKLATRRIFGPASAHRPVAGAFVRFGHRRPDSGLSFCPDRACFIYFMGKLVLMGVV